MPKPRGKRTTLPVDRELFEEFFVLDHDGCDFALDALAVGKIRTPYDVIEMVCVVNKTLASMFINQVAAELEPFGKSDEWLAALDAEDYERYEAIVLSCVTPERIGELQRGTRKQLREELGIPELDPATRPISHYSWPDEDEEEIRELPEGLEPATVPIAPWRFEEYFSLSSPGHRIALDAIRESVIATPYETVEMICNVNLMHKMRLHQLLAQAFVEQFPTEEEAEEAMRNGTFAKPLTERAKTDWFREKSAALMRDIRARFGVPEPGTLGKAEKYKLWSETRRRPIN